jgi:hypothetical protein
MQLTVRKRQPGGDRDTADLLHGCRVNPGGAGELRQDRA